MAAAQRRCLLAVFRSSRSLFLAVICRRHLSKSEGSCDRGRHPGCIFAGFTVFGRKWDQDLRASGAPAAPLAPSCRLAPVREGGGFL